MQTHWEYSTQTETLRVLHATHFIANGFYRLNNFLPFPVGTKPLTQSVILPQANYLSIPRFWDKVTRVNVTDYPIVSINAPQSVLTSTQDLLTSAKLSAPNYQTVKKSWNDAGPELLSIIYELIPHQKDSIKTITIWPTILGTTCSFSLVKKPPHHIQIWLREDQGVAAIVEAILTSLTRKDVYTLLGGLWSESELLVDWLIAYSPLAQILKVIDPLWETTRTIKQTRLKQNAGLVEQSNLFLAKIGAPAAPTNTLYSLAKNILSPREHELFELLKSRAPKPASVDEVADIIFKGDPDSFSLFAISKTIQRLRDKLEKNGISGSYIQTKRGEGYLLAD